jgi:hypothetical protein
VQTGGGAIQAHDRCWGCVCPETLWVALQKRAWVVAASGTAPFAAALFAFGRARGAAALSPSTSDCAALSPSINGRAALSPCVAAGCSTPACSCGCDGDSGAVGRCSTHVHSTHVHSNHGDLQLGRLEAAAEAILPRSRIDLGRVLIRQVRPTLERDLIRQVQPTSCVIAMRCASTLHLRREAISEATREAIRGNQMRCASTLNFTSP